MREQPVAARLADLECVGDAHEPAAVVYTQPHPRDPERAVERLASA